MTWKTKNTPHYFFLITIKEMGVTLMIFSQKILLPN